MAAVLTDNQHQAPAHAREATPEEGRALLDRRARRYLGISGDEFLRRWNAGFYAAAPDAPGVQDIAALLPFIQRDASVSR